MTPIEIIALILIVVSLAKIITILFSPGSWHKNVVKKVYTKSKLTPWIFLILTAIVFYYLIQELTVVQILATTLFITLLFGISLSTFSEEIIGLSQKFAKNKKVLTKSWPSIIIWLILLLWGLKELVM